MTALLECLKWDLDDYMHYYKECVLSMPSFTELPVRGMVNIINLNKYFIKGCLIVIVAARSYKGV